MKEYFEEETEIDDSAFYCKPMITYPIDGTLTPQKIIELSSNALDMYNISLASWELQRNETRNLICAPEQGVMCNDCLARQRKLACAISFPSCNSQAEIQQIPESVQKSPWKRLLIASQTFTNQLGDLVENNLLYQLWDVSKIKNIVSPSMIGICKHFCEEIHKFCDSKIKCSTSPTTLCSAAINISTINTFSIILLFLSLLVIFI